jgi:diguanylate cyclase (GGDEF)-like protein/PAS domain S-box-containing protein
MATLSPSLLLDSVPHGVIATDLDGVITSWNACAEQQYGWCAADAVGKPLAELTPPPALRAEAARALCAVVRLGRLEGEVVGQRRDGAEFPVFMALRRVDGPDGAPAGIVAVSTDLSPRAGVEADLRDAEELFRALYEQASQPVLVLDRQFKVVEVNPAACAFYGMTPAQFGTLSLRDITVGPELEMDAARMLALDRHAAALSDERTHIKRNGDLATVALTAVAVEHHGAPHLVLSVTDLSAHKQTEAALEHRALHDPLTGLPNRSLFQDRLSSALRLSHRNASTLALLLMDVDRFKEINDTFGHRYGDALLQQLGARLSALMRESDTVGRLGGDEFAVLLPDTDTVQARFVAEKLGELVSRPVEIGRQRPAVGLSIGIASFPAHGHSGALLLRRADSAMYVAKRGKLGCTVWSVALDRGRSRAS